MSTVLRMFGLELECFNVSQTSARFNVGQSGQFIVNGLAAMGLRAQAANNHLAANYTVWQVKPDGSLDGGCTNPVEVVSPTLPGTQASLDQVTKVANWLGSNGYDVNKFCGYHIHIDAADMSSYEAACVALRYNHCQREIDSILPPSRRNSRWAQPLAGNALNKVTNAIAHNNRRERWGHGERYVAVNLQHIAKGRSERRIEFRQHSGTLDAGKIVGWYLFLCDFVAETLRLIRETNGGAAPAPAPTVTTAPIVRRQRTRNGQTRSVLVGTTSTPRIPTIDLGTDYDLFLRAIEQNGVVTQNDARVFGWPDTRLRVTAHWLRRNGAELITTQRNGELAYVGANGATTRAAIFTAPAQIRTRVEVGSSADRQNQIVGAPADATAARAILDKLATTPALSGASESTKSWFNARRAIFARP